MLTNNKDVKNIYVNDKAWADHKEMINVLVKFIQNLYIGCKKKQTNPTTTWALMSFWERQKFLCCQESLHALFLKKKRKCNWIKFCARNVGSVKPVDGAVKSWLSHNCQGTLTN